MEGIIKKKRKKNERAKRGREREKEKERRKSRPRLPVNRSTPRDRFPPRAGIRRIRHSLPPSWTHAAVDYKVCKYARDRTYSGEKLTGDTEREREREREDGETASMTRGGQKRKRVEVKVEEWQVV